MKFTDGALAKAVLYLLVQWLWCDAVSLHLHDGAGALGTAAARPRGGGAVLCAGFGPGRHASVGSADVGAFHAGGPVGRGVCGAARRGRRGDGRDGYGAAGLGAREPAGAAASGAVSGAQIWLAQVAARCREGF